MSQIQVAVVKAVVYLLFKIKNKTKQLSFSVYIRYMKISLNINQIKHFEYYLFSQQLQIVTQFTFSSIPTTWIIYDNLICRESLELATILVILYYVYELTIMILLFCLWQRILWKKNFFVGKDGIKKHTMKDVIMHKNWFCYFYWHNNSNFQISCIGVITSPPSFLKLLNVNIIIYFYSFL